MKSLVVLQNGQEVALVCPMGEGLDESEMKGIRNILSKEGYQLATASVRFEENESGDAYGLVGYDASGDPFVAAVSLGDDGDIVVEETIAASFRRILKGILVDIAEGWGDLKVSRV